MKQYKSFEEQVRALVQHPEAIRVTSLPGNIFQEVAEDIAERDSRLGYNPNQKKAQEDWGVVHHQIVDV
jgi:hypothetical protein